MNKHKKLLFQLLSTSLIFFPVLIYHYSYSDAPFASYTNAESTNGSTTFFIASDIHYLSDTLYDNGIAFQRFNSNGDGKQLSYISNIFDSFMYDIKINTPNFLILSGDLTVNGEKESHLKLASKLNEIKKLGTTVYVIPGNHDINNPWARKFSNDKQYKIDSITAKEFSNIYYNYGYKDAISKDSNSLSYLVSPTKQLWLLMLDDNKYKNNISYNMPDISGEISKGTLQWINHCSAMAKNNNAKIVVVTHHNIINHSPYIWDGYTLDNSTDVISVLKECDINLAFSGHIHLQSIKTHSVEDYSLNDISTASMAVYPSKYGVFEVTNENLLSYSTNTVNVDSWNKFINSTDKNLLNFHNFSRNYYESFVYNQNFRNLSLLDYYTNDEIKSMCETLKNIRIKYDDNLDSVSWDDIRNSRGFELLKTCDSIYMKHYVKIATDGNAEINNKIDLVL